MKNSLEWNNLILTIQDKANVSEETAIDMMADIGINDKEQWKNISDIAKVVFLKHLRL